MELKDILRDILKRDYAERPELDIRRGHLAPLSFRRYHHAGRIPGRSKALPEQTKRRYARRAR